MAAAEAAEEEPGFLFYILAFNDETFQEGGRSFPESWNKTIVIPTTKYLESIMYDSVLASREGEWANASYVGTFSYRAKKKFVLPDARAIWKQVKASNPDVIVFVRANTSLLGHAQSSHPNFTRLWYKVLSTMGYAADDILSGHIPTFFCNYWAAKPAWMRAYIDFFRKAKAVIESLPEETRALFEEDSNYLAGGMTPQQCMQIFGKPYYTYYPFLCERLACFFFWKMGAKISSTNVMPVMGDGISSLIKIQEDTKRRLDRKYSQLL
jgi:hypothetical protein